MRSQPLPNPAGQLSRPLRLSVPGPASHKTLLILCLLAGLLLNACDAKPHRPNVVLITIDALRTDSLGIYGNTQGHSPFIDALAQDAVVFDDVVTPIGTTVPSHASMFTGLYPKHHRVRWNGDSLDDSFLTLAEMLSAQGYETCASVSFGSMLGHGGLHQGLRVVSHSPEQHPVFLGADEINEMARRWLDQRTGEPFFLWIHYSEPHSPYPPSPYALQVFAESGYDGDLARGLTVEEFLALGGTATWDPIQRWALRALYDGDVREVDRRVGDLVDDLERRELLGKTILILTADHGQALGEHGDVAHGFLLWQSVIHVPLLIRLPEGGTARRIATRVSLIDITPTVLDLLELAIPGTLDGRSLARALSGEPLPPRTYFAEVRALGNDRVRTTADSERFAVFDGDIKATWDAGVLRIVNLRDDPQEEMAETGGEVGGAQRRALLRLLRSYREGIMDRQIDELPEEVQKELRGLGYLQ